MNQPKQLSTMKSSSPPDVGRHLATVYNNTVLTLDSSNPNLLRYLPIVSGQTAWRDYPTQGPAPAADDLHESFLVAAHDVLYVTSTRLWRNSRETASGPREKDGSQPSLRVPLSVLDCRRMAWSDDYLLLPEVFASVIDVAPVVPAKSNLREGVVWFHGTALLRPMSCAPDTDIDCTAPSAQDTAEAEDESQYRKRKEESARPGMFVIEVDFTMRLVIVVNLVREFPSPVHHHVAFELPKGNGVLLCAGWRTKNAGAPNEETILWVWGEDLPGSIAAGEAPDDMNEVADAGNNGGEDEEMPTSSPREAPRILLDKLLAPNVTRIFSTMPCEYDKRFHFKFDEATRRLVWVGPSTWYLAIDDPYRQWRRLRSVKDQICRSGIPPLGRDALLVYDVASGRQLMVEEKGDVLFLCHTCDAPARVIPIASARKIQPAPLLPLASSSQQHQVSSKKANSVASILHPSPPQAFTSYASSIPLVPVQPKRIGGSNPRKLPTAKKKQPAQPGDDDDANSEASTVKSIQALSTLLGMAKKTRHNIAPALRLVANDDTDVILDLSNCESLDPEEFFCIRRVLGHCPHVMALRLASMAIVTDVFLEGLEKLSTILDVEFADMSIPGSRSALTALDAVLERHRAQIEEKESDKAAILERKEARRNRRAMMREERSTRRNIREQILAVIDEQINRLLIRQHEERTHIFMAAVYKSEVMWHNRNSGAGFVWRLVELRLGYAKIRREIEDEERRGMEQLAKDELKYRNEILRRERQEVERQRKEEAERLRELRRILRERIEAFADVERKARHVIKQEEEADRAALAKQAAVSLDKAKERMHRRLREEAEARQREFERLRRIEEMERAFAAAVIDLMRLEVAKRAEIKKEEDKEFLVTHKKYKEETMVLRLKSIREARCRDRAECDVLPPVLKLSAKVRPHIRIPLLNVLPQRLFYGLSRSKDPSVLLTAEIARVPRHLRTPHQALDPPLEPGELTLQEWQTVKLAVQTVIIRLSLPHLPEGVGVNFVGEEYRIEAGLLFEKDVQDPVGTFSRDETTSSAVDEQGGTTSTTVFTITCTSCTTPAEALDMLSGLALDTSNCYVDAPSFDIMAEAALELRFCNLAHQQRS